MTERRVDVFFYGLFMDEDVLAASNVIAENPRHAYVNDYALTIGSRATLVPSVGAKVYGMIYALTHHELNGLYGAPGLEGYRPEALLTTSLAGEPVPALCYNLAVQPSTLEANPEYTAKLKGALEKLGFPSDYVLGVS